VNDYALLGDGHTAALVDREGSVVWWCTPRFDSPSVFARVLDERGGHWSILPVEPFECHREYVPGTLVLRTTFRTQDGVVRLTDALALAPGVRGHDLGSGSPHAVVRLLEGLEGRVRVANDFVPRPEYGLVVPELREHDGGLRTFGGAQTLVLCGDRSLSRDAHSARAEVVLEAGQSAGWVLHHVAHTRVHEASATVPREAIENAIAGWQSWSDLHAGFGGAYDNLVLHSARVLQALTYQPSGAVVAAATTSLPEIPGGSWNWDYRFAWLRDASMTLQALWVGACPDEAAGFFRWMARAAAGAGESGHVQIVFGVEGERDLTEHELDHLSGFRDSRPVRVGNDAWRQTQLDVYGEVLDGAYTLREQVGSFDEETAGFLCTLADLAAKRWREPDAGIWESREGDRHYLSSKLMCWVALDRAVKLAPRLGAEDRVEDWAAERDRVRDDILRHGWSDDVGAYVGAYGSDHLDASVLLMALVDFVPADDPRMLATIRRIDADLGQGGLVRRWTGAEEGAFVICSFWLAAAYARAGDLGRAREVFEATSQQANDVGLLAEEIDPDSGELVGNFPQAFSHAGLITAAWAIHTGATT